MIFSIPLLVFPLILVMVLFLYKSSASSKHSSLPPSPPGLLIIGNLHQIGGLPYRSLQALARRYGPVMLLKLGSMPTVVVSSAEAAAEVMKTHDLSFASRPPSIIPDLLLYGSRNIALCPYGEYWRQVRRIVVLHLLNPKRVQSFAHIREEEASSMVGKIRSAAGGRVNLSQLLATLTNNIVCRAATGRRYSNEEEEERGKKIPEIMAEFMDLLGAFPVGDYIPWLAWVDNLSGLLGRARRNARELDHLMEQVLDDHLHIQDLSPPAAKDLVDILLSLDEEEDVGIPLQRDSIKAILVDMFAAGIHTTFAAMDWTMAELMRHPAVLKKVQAEVRKNVGSPSHACITEEDISEMVYFKAAIKETLRLHPPAPLLVHRVAVESSKLCGYDVPAKTRVIVNAWAIGRDPKYWDKPDEFIPERFIDSPLGLVYAGSDFQFIPFGAGRRGCPGISFGMLSVELALANLLYHFDLEMADGLKKEEIDMTEVPGITMHRKSSLLLIATSHHF